MIGVQEDKKAVEELFQEYGRLFALDKNDLGHTTKVKHKIKLNELYTIQGKVSKSTSSLI